MAPVRNRCRRAGLAHLERSGRHEPDARDGSEGRQVRGLLKLRGGARSVETILKFRFPETEKENGVLRWFGRSTAGRSNEHGRSVAAAGDRRPSRQRAREDERPCEEMQITHASRARLRERLVGVVAAHDVA